MNQNYLMINESTDTVENVCIWDGNTQTWTPPAGYLMLPQATTPSMVWVLNNNEYELQEQLGQAQIGFTWDGTKCTTNEPKPEVTQQSQPQSSGTQDL